MAEVIEGVDGFYFLANDTNRVLEQFEGSFPVSSEFLSGLCDVHRRRSIAAREINSRYVHIVVPNKEMVLSHLMPFEFRFQRLGLTPLNLYTDLGHNESYSCFYRPNYLRRINEVEPTFPRLDTHWTHFGAISYLRECFRRNGMVDELNAIESMPMAVDAAMQQGDLGAKVSVPPEPIRVHKPRASHARIVGDNLLVNEGHVRAFRNDRAPLQKTLLVHHDSTANWLTHTLRELFAEVVMVHCPDFDLTFLRRFKPAVCLFIQIERFFVRPLSNDIDLASFVKGQEDRKSTNASMTSFLADMAA